MKKHIPNAITLLNLVAGCVGIYFVFRNNLTVAAFLIWIAAIFDFFDGFLARLLKVKSDLGVQLDSLADMVSFGVLPGFIMFILIENMSVTNPELSLFREYLPFIALMIPVFSALRLAKFNIDVRQTVSFIGLPTPANAFFISGFPLIIFQISHTEEISKVLWVQTLFNPYLLIGVTIVFSFLMTSEIRLMALKFKNISWKENQSRYIFILASILLLIVFHFFAIQLIILIYLLISVIQGFHTGKKDAH